MAHVYACILEDAGVEYGIIIEGEKKIIFLSDGNDGKRGKKQRLKNSKMVKREREDGVEHNVDSVPFKGFPLLR